MCNSIVIEFESEDLHLGEMLETQSLVALCAFVDTTIESLFCFSFICQETPCTFAISEMNNQLIFFHFLVFHCR